PRWPVVSLPRPDGGRIRLPLPCGAGTGEAAAPAPASRRTANSTPPSLTAPALPEAAAKAPKGRDIPPAQPGPGTRLPRVFGGPAARRWPAARCPAGRGAAGAGGPPGLHPLERPSRLVPDRVPDHRHAVRPPGPG